MDSMMDVREIIIKAIMRLLKFWTIMYQQIG
jgi:hypothetical protein